MTTKKPSESEDEFFAREEAMKAHKLAVEKARAMAEAERAALKKLHYMHCPKCGMDLQTISLQGVQVDRCFNCHGTWLDEGELERLTGAEPHGLLNKIAAVFRRS
jgi:uncharacterized protein